MSIDDPWGSRKPPEGSQIQETVLSSQVRAGQRKPTSRLSLWLRLRLSMSEELHDMNLQAGTSPAGEALSAAVTRSLSRRLPTGNMRLDPTGASQEETSQTHSPHSDIVFDSAHDPESLRAPLPQSLPTDSRTSPTLLPRVPRSAEQTMAQAFVARFPLRCHTMHHT